MGENERKEIFVSINTNRRWVDRYIDGRLIELVLHSYVVVEQGEGITTNVPWSQIKSITLKVRP